MTKSKKPFSWDGPELVERHLRTRVTESDFELQEQIRRRTVHALINVVKTQFYQGGKYCAIRKDIMKELSRPIYRSALEESFFLSGTAISVCRFCLSHNLYFPFYCLSKIR